MQIEYRNGGLKRESRHSHLENALNLKALKTKQILIQIRKGVLIRKRVMKTG